MLVFLLLPCIQAQGLLNNFMTGLFGGNQGGRGLGKQLTGLFGGHQVVEGGGGQPNGRGDSISQIIHTFTEKHTDVLNQLKNLNIQPTDWDAKIGMLCARYPGLPMCQNGQTPHFTQLGQVVQDVLRDPGKYLPKVPYLNIKDPLAGINQELVNIAKRYYVDLGAITKSITDSLLNVCKWMNCHEQRQETIQLKNLVMKKLYEFEQKQLGRDNTMNINLRADRTQQIKQALLEKAGIGHVVTAADDGIFFKDSLLTESQQNYLLNELGKGGVGMGGAPTKRASVFFLENPTKHWDLPIPYTLDSSLEEFDKNDVRAAIKEIEQKTCIRFIYQSNPRGYHINYQKVDSPTFCGLSYIGRTEPANPVYLSFSCGNARGIALHETMHALGVAHHHLRPDRDQHIRIDWSNIDPQHYDMFSIVDSKLFTSYGVKYDYGSIMHYSAYTGAVNIAKPTMIAKENPSTNQGLLGQRNGMSLSDVEILNKMYCFSPQCEDTNVFCGAWALQNLCQSNNWVAQNCKKSCNYCIGG